MYTSSECLQDYHNDQTSNISIKYRDYLFPRNYKKKKDKSVNN